MQRLLILAIGLVALVAIAPLVGSASTARAVPEQDWHGSLVFFFGNCDEFVHDRLAARR